MRARNGTCAFHCRAWTIGFEVGSRIAGSPLPYTS